MLPLSFLPAHFHLYFQAVEVWKQERGYSPLEAAWNFPLSPGRPQLSTRPGSTPFPPYGLFPVSFMTISRLGMEVSEDILKP